MSAFEQRISEFALHLMRQAQTEQVTISEKTEAMKVLTSYYALLVKANLNQKPSDNDGSFNFADTSERIENGRKTGV